MRLRLFIIPFFTALWAAAIRPGRGRKESMKVFSKQLIAHRGLHDNNGDAPENTLRAFSKAADAGYGIELDVRADRNGEIVVCHDDSLLRVAGVKHRVSQLTREQLDKISIRGTDQRVPEFRDVLETVGGRVPIIVEIKADSFRGIDRLARAVQEVLDAHPETVYCIESFNPAVVRWYKKNRPEIIRGQLSDRFTEEKFPKSLLTLLFSCCAFNCLTKPDFIAYNHRERHLLRVRLIEALYHPSFVAWTIKNAEELKNASDLFDVFIFDSFRPAGPGDVPERVRD